MRPNELGGQTFEGDEVNAVGIAVRRADDAELSNLVQTSIDTIQDKITRHDPHALYFLGRHKTHDRDGAFAAIQTYTKNFEEKFGEPLQDTLEVNAEQTERIMAHVRAAAIQGVVGQHPQQQLETMATTYYNRTMRSMRLRHRLYSIVDWALGYDFSSQR